MNYAFYIDTYLGNQISEEDFYRLVIRAKSKLEMYQRMYIVTYIGENGKNMAICALAEEMQKTERATDGQTASSLSALSSISIGSVSVSAREMMSAEQALNNEERRLLGALCLYALVCRGVESQC